jgi:hypothetical protein
VSDQGNEESPPATLEAGAELFTTYELRCSAVHCFACFGFVPAELLDERNRLPSDDEN